MTRASKTLHPLLTIVLGLALGLQVAAVGLAIGVTTTAHAGETEEELRAMRTHWQDQYRVLLRNKLTLEENIAKSNHDYAQAQRRNYPRGGAREAFRIQAAEAETELAENAKAIAAMLEDARRDDVPMGWLYEVDDESLEAYQPASADSASGDDEDRAGRNPLYLDDDNS